MFLFVYMCADNVIPNNLMSEVFLHSVSGVIMMGEAAGRPHAPPNK